MKAVAIPKLPTTRFRRKDLSETPSTTSSRSALTGYETAATSAFPTPAEFIKEKDINFLALATPSLAMKGKRKRVVAPSDQYTHDDELIAITLQKEEYGDTDHKVKVEPSDESELSDAPSDIFESESSDEPLM